VTEGKDTTNISGALHVKRKPDIRK